MTIIFSTNDKYHFKMDKIISLPTKFIQHVTKYISFVTNTIELLAELISLVTTIISFVYIYKRVSGKFAARKIAGRKTRRADFF